MGYNRSFTDPDTRWEAVPGDGSGWRMSGGLTGVLLRKGERVEWHFQYLPDGTRYAIGYTIHKESECTSAS